MAIVPDDKDWTWVVQRPCPECGYDATGVTREQVAPIIRANAASWEQVLARSDVRQRPTVDRWSPLEYACHVRDVFRIYDYRLGLILTSTTPRIPTGTKTRRPSPSATTSKSPPSSPPSSRPRPTRSPRDSPPCDDDQWSRTGNRSDGARFTVDTFSQYLVHDVVHHIYDVRRVAAALPARARP